MPVWLRLFTMNLLKEHYEKQAEDANEQQELLGKPNNTIHKPNIPEATYKTKASIKK